MPCKDWFEIEKQYRVAVHTYCDAVDRLDSTSDFESAWQQVELTRTDADRARSALLEHECEHHCLPMRVLSGQEQISTDPATPPPRPRSSARQARGSAA
jgi:hypothetical protein